MRIAILGLLVVLGVGVAHAGSPERVVLDVKNMTCPACSITIEKALGQLAGVDQTRVDTKASTVAVTFDSERTTAKAVARAVSDAGFPAMPRSSGD